MTAPVETIDWWERGELHLGTVLGRLTDGEFDAPSLLPGWSRRRVLAHLARNDVVGEIAILCDVPRTATVIASSNLATLRVGKDAFFNLVTQFPQIAVEVMGELASRLHMTTQRLTEASARIRLAEGKAQG